jgi:acetolactate synthase-1/2/3 large subunit
MCQGYYRSSQKIAIAGATSGPGALNMLTATASLYSEGIPALIITGLVDRKACYKGSSQETTPNHIDVSKLFSELSYFSVELDVNYDIEHLLTLAMSKLFEAKGPVHLSIPSSLWDKEIVSSLETIKLPRLDDIRGHNVKGRSLLKELLRDSEKPVFVLGEFLEDGSKESLDRFFVSQKIPFLTTPSSRAFLGDEHPSFMGHIGLASYPVVQEVIAESDIVIFLGSSLDETQTYSGKNKILNNKKKVLICEYGSDYLEHFLKLDHVIMDDLDSVVPDLKNISSGNYSWDMLALKKYLVESYDQQIEKNKTIDIQNNSLNPILWRDRFNKITRSQEKVIYSDIGGHMLFNLKYLKFGPKDQFYLDLKLGSMTSGLLSALGHAADRDETKTLYAIVGDACFFMMSMELITAKEYDLPLIVMIENNQMHSITWHGGKMIGYADDFDLITNQKKVSISSFTKEMGIESYEVRDCDTLANLLTEQEKQKGPMVIDLMVDGKTIGPPLGERAKSIAGFSNG